MSWSATNQVASAADFADGEEHHCDHDHRRRIRRADVGRRGTHQDARNEQVPAARRAQRTADTGVTTLAAQGVCAPITIAVFSARAAQGYPPRTAGVGKHPDRQEEGQDRHRQLE
jgi:hypothetical protein